jgi:hypothetical protein
VEHEILNLSSRRLTHPAAAGGRGRHSFSIAGEFLTPLRALSSSDDAALFAVLVAVLDLLLLRYLGSEDIVVAGRNGGSRTIPLCIHVPDDPTFLDLMERVHHAIQSAGADPEIASCKALLILSGSPANTESAQYDVILVWALNAYHSRDRHLRKS